MTTAESDKSGHATNDRTGEIIEGLANQSTLINDKLTEIIAALDNQARGQNEQQSEVIAALDNQSRLLSDRLAETVLGLDNQSRLLAEKLDKLVLGLDHQSQLLSTKLEKLIEGIKNQSQLFNRKITEVIVGLGNVASDLNSTPRAEYAGRNDPSVQEIGPWQVSTASSDIDRFGNLTFHKQRVAIDRRAATPKDVTPQKIDLESFRDVFKGIRPWSGYVPPQFIVDFLGTRIDIEFHPMLFTDPSFNATVVGGSYQETVVPRLADVKTPADAEAWFEAADWVTAAREARDRYVMITLGANYGAQAVGAYRALQAVNPMPYRLVAVEPVPANVDWIRQHMTNNGIDPDQQWILPLAISDSVEPLLFPVGGAGVGSNNAYSTNEKAARAQYAEEFIARGMGPDALRNLLMNNTTGLMQDLVPGHDFQAEIKLISSITLNELLGPIEKVDLLESDIQQSEILVFPPFMDLLRRKVRRIHIGTHGEDVHVALLDLFAENGWEIVFDFKPNCRFESASGNFETNDGVLTVRNPDL